MVIVRLVLVLLEDFVLPVEGSPAVYSLDVVSEVGTVGIEVVDCAQKRLGAVLEDVFYLVRSSVRDGNPPSGPLAD
jgi:hypothetical protein